jgi:hypothetical protein
MAEQKKEPMIGKSSRPTAIDYDAPVAGLKVGELIGILSAHAAEHAKAHREYYKPEIYKPEFYKPEYYKPELYKPDFAKEHKEGAKEKAFVTDPTGDPLEELAARVAEHLRRTQAK